MIFCIYFMLGQIEAATMRMPESCSEGSDMHACACHVAEQGFLPLAVG